MLNNFYIIREVASYLNQQINGLTISSIFTQEKNKMMILFEESSRGLEFSIEKDYNYILLKENIARAKRNYSDLFGEARGKKITQVSLCNDDRAIEFKFDGNESLVFTFFTIKANCYYISGNEILNSFKQKNELLNENVSSIFDHPDHTVSGRLPSDTNAAYVKSTFPKFGRIYAEEIFSRLKIEQRGTADKAAKDEIDRCASEIISEFENPDFVLYENYVSTDDRRENNLIVSLMELSHLKSPYKMFSDVNGLIEVYVRQSQRREKFLRLKTNLYEELTKKLQNTRKRINGLKTQYENGKRSEEFRKYGEEILNNIHNIRKGDEELEFDSQSGKAVRIKLKPDLSPSENAQMYFDKFRKQKSSIDMLEKKIVRLEKEESDLKIEIEKIKNMSEIKSLMKEEKKSESQRRDETSRFRKFKLNDSLEVWVGKDAAANDLLTKKYSAQNDLWFHVRGASGSHTVLKVSNKKSDVSKDMIQTAASIAAYYSKARNALSVPVAYCERKFVKKKKGFKQGTVVMEREKVIFVKPGIPFDEKR